MALRGLDEGVVFAQRYRVVRCIAEGGMGAVYEVIHIETERRRALKVMHPHTVERDDLRVRFKQEARVAAAVESEHIVDVFDAGIDEKTAMPFLVMELLRGEELGRALKRVGRLPPDEALLYLHQASLALDKTHRARIVHRDLKPENLFLCERDEGPPRVKILDFGIAKIVADGATKANATRALGTPLYMAPEQFRQGTTVSPATDIFALGMIAYTLLVGVPYWHEEQVTSDNVYAFVATAAQGPQEPASVRALKRGVTLSPSFDAWFAKATAAFPPDRFASASAAVQALADALGRPRPGYGRMSFVSAADISAPRPMSPSDAGLGAAVPSGAPAVPSVTLPTHADLPIPEAKVTSPEQGEGSARAQGAPMHVLGAASSGFLPQREQSLVQHQASATQMGTGVTGTDGNTRRSPVATAVAIALPLVAVGSAAVYFYLANQEKLVTHDNDSINARGADSIRITVDPTPPLTMTTEGPVVVGSLAPTATVTASASGVPSASSTGERLGGGTPNVATSKTPTPKATVPEWTRD